MALSEIASVPEGVQDLSSVKISEEIARIPDEPVKFETLDTSPASFEQGKKSKPSRKVIGVKAKETGVRDAGKPIIGKVQQLLKESRTEYTLARYAIRLSQDSVKDYQEFEKFLMTNSAAGWLHPLATTQHHEVMLAAHGVLRGLRAPITDKHVQIVVVDTLTAFGIFPHGHDLFDQDHHPLKGVTETFSLRMQVWGEL